MVEPAEVRLLAGRCQCGVVQYTVPDAFRYALNCHCSDCRRVTGAAFKPLAGIERAKVSFTSGADRLKTIGVPDACNLRCESCGSFLMSVVREGAYVHVAMGSLTDAPTIRPSAHVYVGSKAPWFTITDDLPQFDGHAGASQPKYRES